jgi:DNA-binding Xre family transcriptional regulator
MLYSELKEIVELKKIEIQQLANELEMTPNGFRESIKNDTIQLRKLKKLCEVLRISPAQFFDSGTYGVTITTGHVQAGNGNKMILENKEREINQLREQLNDKTEIIKMLKEKIYQYENISIAANSANNNYGKKK